MHPGTSWNITFIVTEIRSLYKVIIRNGSTLHHSVITLGRTNKNKGKNLNCLFHGFNHACMGIVCHFRAFLSKKKTIFKQLFVLPSYYTVYIALLDFCQYDGFLCFSRIICFFIMFGRYWHWQSSLCVERLMMFPVSSHHPAWCWCQITDPFHHDCTEWEYKLQVWFIEFW